MLTYPAPPVPTPSTTTLPAPDPAALRIRAARCGDLPDLLRLERACFQPAARYSGRSWCRFLGRHRRSRRIRILVANVPCRPLLGFVLASLPPEATVARVAMLAVDGEVRGLGLGSALLAALVARLPARCTGLSLEVGIDNAPAQGLYRRLGFTPVGPASPRLLGQSGYWTWRADREAVVQRLEARGLPGRSGFTSG